jgi:hypothetical protein
MHVKEFTSEKEAQTYWDSLEWNWTKVWVKYKNDQYITYNSYKPLN